MSQYEGVLIAAGIAVLAFFSGVLGFGVALAAVPFLSLFLDDLAHQVHPMSLALGGATALFLALLPPSNNLLHRFRGIIANATALGWE